MRERLRHSCRRMSSTIAVTSGRRRMRMGWRRFSARCSSACADERSAGLSAPPLALFSCELRRDLAEALARRRAGLSVPADLKVRTTTDRSALWYDLIAHMALKTRVWSAGKLLLLGAGLLG